MLNYAIKRIGLAFVILFTVMLAMCAMVFLVPGDPASLALGPRATPALKELLRERMGLDQPVLAQIWHFFRNAATGDLGYDVWSKRPVLDQILEFFPNTLILGAVALGWAVVLGILLGCAAVVWRGAFTDRILNLVALTDSTSQTIAQIIQASLGEAGITVEIQPTEEAAYWALGDKTAGDDYLSLEMVLQSYAGGIDPTENLVWFRPDQIGVYNWTFFDSPEYEDLYQTSLVELDPEKRRAMFNRMEDLMEESGSFLFICFEPLVAIHDSDLRPVILADGHPDPVQFTRA